MSVCSPVQGPQEAPCLPCCRLFSGPGRGRDPSRCTTCLDVYPSSAHTSLHAIDQGGFGTHIPFPSLRDDTAAAILKIKIKLFL